MRVATYLGFFGLLFTLAVSTSGQSPSIANRSIGTFYNLVLRNFDFFGNNDDTTDPIDVNVLGVPSGAVPKLPGINFVTVTKKEVVLRRLTEDGFQYYEIHRPQLRGSRWYLTISREQRFKCSGNGLSVEYEFRQVGGRWKFRKGPGHLWVEEGGECPNTDMSPPLSR